MYMVIDTETTGLPKRWSAPASDINNWPRLVQIAWILFGKNGDELERRELIIKPIGYSIPKDASRIHGIYHTKALDEGVLIATALGDFISAVAKSQTLVAHNMSFDENVIAAELIRAKLPDAFSGISKVCTKDISTNYCKLPGRYGYKWPSLQELHLTLFGQEFAETHHALADARVCAKCFFALKSLGIA